MNIIPQHHSMGWVADLPDQRDRLYAAPAPVGPLPPLVDLRPQCPPVYDQGQLGSCTANAIAGALEFDRIKQRINDFTPSRLMIYYNERALEGTTKSDSGAQIRDGIKTVVKQGACPEPEWPYYVTKFKMRPTPACYLDGLKYKAILYQRIVPTLDQLKGCLATGLPFVFGFTVYESFESAAVAQTGIAPMPAPGERAVGGHAVVGVGYIEAKQVFIVRNSWGPDWGMAGYFTIPYSYLTNASLADDFWQIKTVAQ
jgi:C1A family cysteine protease